MVKFEMCFNKELTMGFTLFSCVMGTWILSGKGIWEMEKWRRLRIAACFYWFAFMEFLQYVQYLVIGDCSSPVNQLFTALGWVHIGFQPLFSNLAFSALDKRNQKKERDETWKYIFKFCIVVGVLMTLRIVIPAYFEEKDGMFFKFPKCTEDIEGVCGEETCSTKGKYHVQWTFKMIKPSYTFPSISVHFLDMFVVPILMGIRFGSVILFLTGPAISMLFNGVKDGERSAIWCFFSIMETCITVGSQYWAVRRDAKKQKKQ